MSLVVRPLLIGWDVFWLFSKGLGILISVECLQASRSLRYHLWLHLLRLPGSNGRFWRATCGLGPRGPPLLTVTERCLKAPLFLCPSGIMSGRGVVWVVTLLLWSECVYFKCVRPRSNERARMMWWSLTDPLPTKSVKVISACIVGYAALYIVVFAYVPFEIDRDERKWSCPVYEKASRSVCGKGEANGAVCALLSSLFTEGG